MLAELRSTLRGASHLETMSPVLRGTIHGLERGQTATGVTFEALVYKLKQHFGYTRQELQSIHESMAPDGLFVDFDDLRGRWGLGDKWLPHHLPRLLRFLPPREPLALYGRGPNWAYAALAGHAGLAPLYQFDPRLGWIAPPRLTCGPVSPEAPLQARVYPTVAAERQRSGERQRSAERRRSEEHLFFYIPGGYLDFPAAQSLAVPPVQPQQGVILDGKLPLWLFTALVRCYREAPWLAVYQPQLEAYGWKHCAVVACSRRAEHPVGSLVPLPDPQPVALASQAALSDWLAQHGVDTTHWGRGGTKTVADLWAEIQNGEAELQAPPPVRCITVAQVLVRQGGRVLHEQAQQRPGGQRRARGTPPGEKVRPGESISAAARRCLQEELGASADPTFCGTPAFRGTLAFRISLVSQAERPRYKKTISPSYPGLPTLYAIYPVEARVVGLPQSDFWTVEAAAAPEAEPVRHYWTWVEEGGE